MLLTVLGYILLALLILLVIVVVLVINVELFVYADYSHGRSVYSLRVVAKLFRYWQLFQRCLTEDDAKITIESVAKDVVEKEQPQLAEVLNEHITPADRVNLKKTSIDREKTFEKPVDDFRGRLAPPEVAFKLQQSMKIEQKRDGSRSDKPRINTAKTDQSISRQSSKFVTIAKEELYNNPGRNVLLLIALLFDIKKLICYLIKTAFRAFNIKKLAIKCKFGAEDPFDTGQVAAIVYTSVYSINYIREHKHIRIDFKPDFEKESFEFDGDAIILIKATTALLKIFGAIIGAVLKGVFYYGGKIAWRLGPNYFRKPKESNIN
ncbi:MAG: DUF2953 domain-containing protein [Negativicutes bacterium]|jgi:hypothetical protein